MDVEDATRMAQRLLELHGLDDWTLVLDRAKTRAGICRYGTRQIGLSRPLTLLHDEAQVRDTVLHEIAHALAGPRAQHGPRWRATALRVGANPQRCVPADAPRVPGPWVGRCPAGHERTRHRRPTRVESCSRCLPRFCLDHLVQWRFHGVEVPMSAAYAASLARAQGGLAGADGAPSPPAVLPVLPVGTPVRLGGGGRWAGARGTVVKRGRTRYHVRTATGLLTAPFALVQPVGDLPSP